MVIRFFSHPVYFTTFKSIYLDVSINKLDAISYNLFQANVVKKKVSFFLRP